MKPSVLVVAPAYPSVVHRYAGVFVHGQALAMQRDYGLDVRVLAFTPWAPRAAGVLSEHWRRYANEPKAYGWDGVSVRKRRLFLLPRNLSISGAARQARIAIGRELEAQRPDLVHAHFAYPTGWAAVQAAARRRVPCLLTVHGSDVNRVPGLSRWCARGVRSALRGASAVIAVSMDLKQKVAALAGVDATVIYNGVRLGNDRGGTTEPQRAERGPDLLYVGNLLREKGVYELLAATRRVPDVSLTIIGDGRERAGICRYIEAAAMGTRVTVRGSVPNDEARSAMAKARLLVLPSHSEGLPTVAVEALAAGIPVLATDVGGTREIVRHGATGLLVEPGDVDQLVLAIRALLDDDGQRARMGENGRELVRRQFDQKSNARLLAELYERVLV